MIGVKRMDKTWTDEFYREMDADKRLVLLKENIESNPTEEDAFRKKLWLARYGRKKPKKDAYVGCLMELKYLAEGGTLDIGGKKKRQAARIAADMYLNSPEVQIPGNLTGRTETCVFKIHGSKQSRKRVYFTGFWYGTVVG